ncbi:tetraacyldisaccharide 4'-kinase, partial [Desulfovibrio sp. OttesenSCG-928-C06]|nr:tetraacyldisaccharide 4'-kinase [Desulfovibrio sp. OttesenSCG-928-C06]
MPFDYRKTQKTLSPLLVPLSKGYGALMRARAWAYSAGIKSSQKTPTFCISVGNISWGGTGKTPLTGWMLDWAAHEGLKAVVLTRGYGGKTERRPLLVTPDTNPEESGDEPLMLCRQHPEASILADPNRRRAQLWAEEHLRPDLYILDDGMQHLAVQRDLNLVTLSLKDFTQDWNRVIPAGTWREGSSALRRADAFMLRATPGAVENLPLDKLDILRSLGVPLFSFDLAPTGITPLRAAKMPEAGRPEEIAEPAAREQKSGLSQPENPEEQNTGRNILSGKQPYALCTAVGTPESVLSSAKSLIGSEPETTFIFADHHPYSYDDLEKIRAE